MEPHNNLLFQILLGIAVILTGYNAIVSHRRLREAQAQLAATRRNSKETEEWLADMRRRFSL